MTKLKTTVDLVGVAEIAVMSGVTAQAVSNWIKRHEDFPKPVATLAMGSVWQRGPIEKWLNDRIDKRVNNGRKKAS